MVRYWIAVASKEHVKKGVAGGFAQVCHGKSSPLNRMEEGDWIIYYSPTTQFRQKEPCQSFTAIGKIKGGNPYLFPISEYCIPWRRDVSFLKSEEATIRALLDELSFIKDKQKWGFPFRRGCFEITQQDFEIIKRAMGVLS